MLRIIKRQKNASEHWFLFNCASCLVRYRSA